MAMNWMRFLLPLALLLAGPALASSDQDIVNVLVQRGEIRTLDQIKALVRPQIKGDYIGEDFDPVTLRYQLRYMRDGEVVNVLVDARTGQVVRSHY